MRSTELSQLGTTMMSCEQSVLKIDLDAGDTFVTRRMLDHRLARAGYRRATCVYRRSPSRTGWHIILTVTPQPQTPIEVVALQAILGSDPLREACNLRRAHTFPHASPFWRNRWNVLYIKPSPDGKEIDDE